MAGFSATGEAETGGLSALQQLYVITAADTAEGKKRLQEYYEALGRFVHMFAQVETQMTLTLRQFTGMPDPIAKVVLSGSKIELSSSHIKQLASASNLPVETIADLEGTLQQLAIINAVRNNVLHFGATQIEEGTAVVSDALRAKGEPTTFPISPTALDQMTGDLRAIIIRLYYRPVGGMKLPSGHVARTVLESAARAPWRYKHPQPPSKAGNKPPAHSRKRASKPLPPP